MKKLYVFSTLVSSAANLRIITLMNTCQTFHNKKSPQGSRFTMTLMEVLLCCIVSRFVTHSNTGCFYTNLEYDYIWLQLFCLAKF